MAKFDASYQIRVGLVDPELPQGEESAAMPTIAEIEATVSAALEAAYPAYGVYVSAERLDRD
jgi:hypothetical protein